MTAPAKPRPGSREAAQLAQLKKQDEFLAAYATLGNVLRACEKTGVGRRTHYDWLEKDPVYAKKFEDAQEDATDVLEHEARRRAIVGVREPVYGPIRNREGAIIKHGVVGEVTKYSDTLLIMLLNGNRPQKFKQRHEHTGPNGGPLHLMSHLRGVTGKNLAEAMRQLGSVPADALRAPAEGGRRATPKTKARKTKRGKA